MRIVWAAFPLLVGFTCWALFTHRNQLRAGLALAGLFLLHACMLDSYVAGPVVGYHHLTVRSWFERQEGGPIASHFLRWLAVGAFVWTASRVTDAGPSLQRALPRPAWRRLAFLALALIAAAKISRPASWSSLEFFASLTLQMAAIAYAWHFVRELRPSSVEALDSRLVRWFGAAGGNEPEPGGADRFAWGLAIASTALAALLAFCIYGGVPHVPDEMVYLFQARYLAAGHLWLEPPPVPQAFDLDLMLLDQGKWYCPVPPGWPLVLAIGAFAGVPWLVNPLLGGATVLVVYALLRELAPKRTARIGIALLASSPWFVFLNMSFMTHPLTLLAACVAALGVARSRRTGSIASCALSGVAIGVAALVRPLDGMLLAVLLGLWSIGLGAARLRIASIAALVVSTAVSSLATLYYNRLLTGDVRSFPIQRYVDVVYGPGKNDMGFGPDKGLGWGGLDPWPGHSLGEALVTSQFNLFGVSAELFGWPSGSLVLVWLWLLRAKWSRTDRAMASFSVAIVVASWFYWFNGGPDFGARYWHLILVPMIWLTVRGLGVLESSASTSAHARLGVAALAFVAMTTWIPWRAFDKYLGYRGTSAAPVEALAAADAGRDLVLVQGERHPEYASLAWLNPARWDADEPVIAWARDPQTTAAILRAFHDRPLRVARAEPDPSASEPFHVKFEVSEPLTPQVAWMRLAVRDGAAPWRDFEPRFREDGSLAEQELGP